MKIKFCRKHKTFFVATVCAFLFFVAILVFSGKRMYNIESERSVKDTWSRIFTGKNIISRQLTDSVDVLLSVRDRAAAADPYSPDYPKRLKDSEFPGQLFASHAVPAGRFTGISIADSSGRQIAAFESPAVELGKKLPDGGKGDFSADPCFRTLVEKRSGDADRAGQAEPIGLPGQSNRAGPVGLAGDVCYASIVGAGGAPIGRLAAAITGNDGRTTAVVLLDIDFSGLMEPMPEGVSIYTSDGYLLQKAASGGVSVIKTAYDLKGAYGEMPVSPTVIMHYSLVNFMRDKSLYVMSNRDMTAHFKGPFPLFLITSSLLIVLFAALTLIVVYVNYRWYVELINSRKALLSSLSSLAEGRDTDTGRHLERTKKYGNVLARRLAKNPGYADIITDDLIEDYLDAFPLHDIGKVGIRDSILLKPGKLTEEEFEEIKKHSTIGKHVLQNAIERFKLTDPLFHLAKNVCAHHHEKFNGKGYPEGFKGRAIPLEARIFALCDVYDAIRSKRCYKDEVPHEKVVGIIIAERGEHFDPDVVDAFLDVQNEFQEIHDSYKYLVDYYGQVFMADGVSKSGIRWTAELEVGVEIIDTQHRELFKMINDFIKAVGEGKGRDEIGRTLEFLKEYVNTHFSMEEGYMRKFNYPEYELHLKQHADFMELVRNMTDGVGDAGVNVSVLIREVERAVGEWLVNHIIVVDKNLGKFLADKLK